MQTQLQASCTHSRFVSPSNFAFLLLREAIPLSRKGAGNSMSYGIVDHHQVALWTFYLDWDTWTWRITKRLKLTKVHSSPRGHLQKQSLSPSTLASAFCLLFPCVLQILYTKSYPPLTPNKHTSASNRLRVDLSFIYHKGILTHIYHCHFYTFVLKKTWLFSILNIMITFSSKCTEIVQIFSSNKKTILL